MSNPVMPPQNRHEFANQIAIEQNKVKLKALEADNDKLRDSLEAIFDAIERGETIDIATRSGVVTITRARPKPKPVDEAGAAGQ